MKSWWFTMPVIHTLNPIRSIHPEGIPITTSHVADANAAHHDPIAGRRDILRAQGGRSDDVRHGDRRTGRRVWFTGDDDPGERREDSDPHGLEAVEPPQGLWCHLSRIDKGHQS